MKNFKPNKNFVYYLYWICERQDIFWKRLNGEKAPFSKDEIFNNFKFTNVYRVLDRSSQYLLSNVIYNGKEYSKEDMIVRILLYKHFNLPTTWDSIINDFGDIRSNISFEKLSKFLDSLKGGQPIYSNAYMLTASFMKNKKIKEKYGIFNDSSKSDAYLKIFNKYLFEDNYLQKILDSKSFTELNLILKSIITVGDFIAYQYAQDFNYTDFINHDINEICFAGPGTIRGIERTFEIEGKPDYSEIVKWVYKNFEQLLEDYSKKFSLDLSFNSLPNHLPQVPDLSNCFCETDKYLRGARVKSDVEVKGSRIKNSFKENKNKIEYIFPKKWGVKL